MIYQEVFVVWNYIEIVKDYFVYNFVVEWFSFIINKFVFYFNEVVF